MMFHAQSILEKKKVKMTIKYKVLNRFIAKYMFDAVNASMIFG